MVERIADDTLKLSPETLKNLTVSAVKFDNVPEQLAIMGKISVAEDRTSLVAARVAGRIDNVFVPSGAVISAGTPLLSLFSPDYVIAREEYLQTLTQVRAGDEEEKSVLKLARQKLESMGVTPYDIDHLDTTEKNSNLVVRAPRSGAVIDKKAIIGNLVNPGDPLFTVGDTKSIWFMGDLYPADLDKVHKGQDLVVTPDIGAKSVHGKVSFISPLIDPVTRTIKIRAEMENPENSLRLDMYVRGNVILNQKEALIMPKSALVRDGSGFVAFKELPNNVFKRVPIETLGESGALVIISKGLQAGDQVVSDGALLLVSALATNSSSTSD
jgi:RND family efflux transporter MFP subunit